MFDAAENGDVEFISQRLSVPVSRFREPGTGRTLLHAACYAAQVEVVKYLLEDNVDLSDGALWCDDFGNTPLITAAYIGSERHGDEEIAKLLLAAGASVNERKRCDGMTALMWSAFHGDVDFLKVLCDAGEVNPVDTAACDAMHGYFAVDFAGLRGQRDATSFLIQHAVSTLGRHGAIARANQNADVDLHRFHCHLLYWAAALDMEEECRKLTFENENAMLKRSKSMRHFHLEVHSITDRGPACIQVNESLTIKPRTEQGTGAVCVSMGPCFGCEVSMIGPVQVGGERS